MRRRRRLAEYRRVQMGVPLGTMPLAAIERGCAATAYASPADVTVKPAL
jgi:hypothetical protein